ncbi:uncharacterized protein L201_008098 [Kwoniella dendrophila CBS 6074]|uniref:TatD DNase n=1 Tax=Kwoniella dendrophila CBS 6074 TaxID=1295534 RepID=A0AAX4K618_9TREE
MCSQHDDNPASSSKQKEKGNAESKVNDHEIDNEMPDWETIELPPDHILSHLVDIHCHPTDLTHSSNIYDDVKLGGLASMATIIEDQDKVRALSEDREWYNPSHTKNTERKGKGKGWDGKGVGVIACFGYHPWFTHLYTLSSTIDSKPSKSEHYFQLFSPTSQKNKDLLESLLPYLPDPIPFQPLIDKLKDDIKRSLNEGRLTMLGEVGLDGSARMRWPKKAKHLHPDHANKDQDSHKVKNHKFDDDQEEVEEWKRLTPFKVPMSHQRAILEKQMDLAVELGVNVSFHSVACAGPSLDLLISMRNKHGIKFTNGINVDIHSAGGWSAEFWKQAERNLSNIYASPSIFITGRSPNASSLLSTISKDRLLVESDSHDVRLSDRLVWASAAWIANCKKWKLESRDQATTETSPENKSSFEEWSFDDEDKSDDGDDEFDEKGKLKTTKRDETDVWTVKTLEKNWYRFMRL